jgi:type IV pilus assembly protein PilN
MRITVNLASRPFVELRPLFAKLRLAMIGLAVLAIALGVSVRAMSNHVRVAEAHMDALKAQTTALNNERFASQAKMRQPQNQVVLDQSKFLNQLFAEKSFSWTTVMMDLERVLPAGVQVVSIEPAITPDGEVNIRLRVTGDRDRAVELVRNLERSRRYVAPRLANETAQTQEQQGRLMQTGMEPGVQFDILSGYNPLAVVEPKPAAKKTPAAARKAAGAAATKAGSPQPKPANKPAPAGGGR